MPNMNTLDASDLFHYYRLSPGVVTDNALETSGGEVEKRRMIDYVSMDINYMKISFANDDEKNIGHTDIQKDRLVERSHPPSHVSIDDYCGPALEIFRLFPIPEDDRGAWIKHKRSEKEERMDCFIRFANAKAPHPKNQLHPNPLSKGSKRAPPRMNGTLKPRKKMKRSPSKDRAQRLSSSRGHSVNLFASAASSESDDQDSSQQEGRPLHIHASRQETKDSSARKPEDDMDPPAANQSLVNQCETDTKDKAASGPVTPQKEISYLEEEVAVITTLETNIFCILLHNTSTCTMVKKPRKGKQRSSETFSGLSAGKIDVSSA